VVTHVSSKKISDSILNYAPTTSLQIFYSSLISLIHSVLKALVTESSVKLTTKQTTKFPAPGSNPLPPPFVSRSTLLTAVPTSQLCRGFLTNYFSSDFPNKIFHAFYMLFLSRLPRFEHFNTIWRELRI
jgi:hypothetical protein